VTNVPRLGTGTVLPSSRGLVQRTIRCYLASDIGFSQCIHSFGLLTGAFDPLKCLLLNPSGSEVGFSHDSSGKWLLNGDGGWSSAHLLTSSFCISCQLSCQLSVSLHNVVLQELV